MATDEGWSDLLPELLHVISTKLHNIADFVTFRSVCKSWSTATSLSDLPPQIPWLLEERNRIEMNTEILRFYSLASNEVRTIRCPQARGKLLFGPSHGYLYATNFDWIDLKHSLLNPLIRHEVPIRHCKYFNPSRVCMGPDPIRSDYHMAFSGLTYDGARMMGFYQPRYLRWEYFAEFVYQFGIGHACLKGRYYMNDIATGATGVADIASRSEFWIPPHGTYRGGDHVYFVESAGKILRIVKRMDCDLAASDGLFGIYQLDVQNGEPKWVDISGIGDQMLFLDGKSGISSTASESSGLRGNCIYYLESEIRHVLLSCHVYRYNIEDGQSERVPCPLEKGSTWLVPSAVRFEPEEKKPC